MSADDPHHNGDVSVDMEQDVSSQDPGGGQAQGRGWRILSGLRPQIKPATDQTDDVGMETISAWGDEVDIRDNPRQDPKQPPRKSFGWGGRKSTPSDGREGQTEIKQRKKKISLAGILEAFGAKNKNVEDEPDLDDEIIDDEEIKRNFNTKEVLNDEEARKQWKSVLKSISNDKTAEHVKRKVKQFMDSQKMKRLE